MLAMWESLPSQNLENGGGCCPNLDVREQPSNGEPWFKSIFNTVLRYKNGLFGHYSPPIDQKQRAQDYIIPVNYKFIFGLCEDGFFRPGAIVGKNKKQQEFVVYFYHDKKCTYVKRKDMLLKHGNLLDKKVFFCHCGQRRKGKVYGNNSPANHGFPSIFYLKKKNVWYKVSFKCIFLSKKMVRKCNLENPRKQSEASLCKSKSNIFQLLS